jgi:hypothetical protein
MPDDSRTAFRHVRRLDPTMRTSMMYTLFSVGEFDHALDEARHGDYDLVAQVLLYSGRREEAARTATEHSSIARGTFEEAWFRSVQAAAAGELASYREISRAFEDFPDPEGRFFVGLGFAYLGAYDDAKRWAINALDGGYCNLAFFAHHRFYDPLAGDAEFEAALARARERSERARTRFGGRLQDPAPAR